MLLWGGGTWVMSKQQNRLKHFFEKFKGNSSQHEDCYETLKKLLGNSKYSKYDDLKKFSALAKLLASCKKISE